MSDRPEKLITDEGLRLDGRRMDEIRPMKIEIGVLSRADGSCYLEWGKNKILVGVYGPREVHPRRSQRSDSAVVRYRYNMASFSVEDRTRPGPNRRSIEISKVSREAFEPVIMAELFPKAAIDIFVEVLQADAGTRTAAINASSIALADAGIPMKGLITSCAFGKVDGKIVLDLNKDEDNYGEADFPVAMTQDGEITLLQMDGHLTLDEIKQGLELAKIGCKQIFEVQQDALRKKFSVPKEDSVEGSCKVEEKTEVMEIGSVPESVLEAAISESIEKLAEEEKGVFSEFEGIEAEEVEEVEEAEEKAESVEVEEELNEKTEKEEFEKEIETEDELEKEIEEEEEEEEEGEEEIFEKEIETKNELEKEIETETVEEETEEEAEEEFKIKIGAEKPEKKVEVKELEKEIEAGITEKETEKEVEFEKTAEEEKANTEEIELEKAAEDEKTNIENEFKEEAEEEFKTEIGTEELEKEIEIEKEAKSPWKVVKDPSKSGLGGEDND